MAVFTSRFIDQLIEPSEKEMAKAFNNLTLSDEIEFEMKGLFGCLFSVRNALSNGRSLAFEEALFRGVVKPIFLLFKDVEKYGDLNENSINKLSLANKELLAAKRRYEHVAPRNKLNEIHYAREVLSNTQLYQDQMRRHEYIKYRTKDLEKAERKLQRYQQGSVKKTKRIRELTESIESLKLVINQVKEDIQIVEERHIRPYMDSFMSALENEGKVLTSFFEEYAKELAYMESCTKAIMRQQDIDKIPKAKKRKKALDELSEFKYFISDFSSVKADIENLSKGVKFIIPLSQGKLAVMGHSDGFCAGFAAEFLLLCSEPGWDELTLRNKIHKLTPVLQDTQMPTMSMPFDPSHNKLALSLLSGILFHNQTKAKIDVSPVFLVRKDNNIEDEISKNKFYGEITSKIIETFSEHKFENGAINYYIAFGNNERAHAVAVSCGKDGKFLFQDSNYGFIACKDKETFSKFFANYMRYYYPKYTYCWFNNFDHMKKHYDVSQYPEFKKFLENQDQYDLGFEYEERREEKRVEHYTPLAASQSKPARQPIPVSQPMLEPSVKPPKVDASSDENLSKKDLNVKIFTLMTQDLDRSVRPPSWYDSLHALHVNSTPAKDVVDLARLLKSIFDDNPNDQSLSDSIDLCMPVLIKQSKDINEIIGILENFPKRKIVSISGSEYIPEDIIAQLSVKPLILETVTSALGIRSKVHDIELLRQSSNEKIELLNERIRKMPSKLEFKESEDTGRDIQGKKRPKHN